MTKIKELPAILADQIAAGEVVERPASVVKELVENAIDAQSTQIDIYVADSGLSLIKVIDNGQGIAADELELAFRRHSTSKLHDKNGLFKIRTLGFRGEALPSIASVADVTLKTAMTDGQGMEIEIRGGQQLDKKIIARPQGTEVMVRSLFYNTPARLKYLKSPQTELAVISDIVDRLALGHPEIALSLHNNKRVLLQTAGNNNLQQTISAIYGVKNAQQMLPVHANDLDFAVEGFVSLPKLTRATKNYITLLLNGRYIRNYQLTNAVIKGYGSKLMVGRYPMAIIALKLDPVLVDVNVHPTKQEVRISKEKQLCELIQTTIYQRLATENLIPDALADFKAGSTSLNFADLDAKLNETSQQYRYQDQAPVVTKQSLKSQQSAEKKAAKTPIIATEADKTIIIEKRQDLTDKLKNWDQKYQNSQVLEDPQATVNSKLKTITTGPAKKRFPDLRYLVQIHDTYLLAEAEDGFYLVDQHAAQERCKYEYFRVAMGKVAKDQQALLVPLVLDYSTSDALIIQKNIAKLAEVGVQLEEFGQNSFIIHQHPTWFEDGKEETMIREMIDCLLRDGKISIAAFREQTAINMSCRLSIKAHHHLDDRQAQALLSQLAECENPFNCPHGRPVLVHFSQTAVEKMFKRIQDPHQSQRNQL
ncbi:DNA mismatch repair endonuclease MutL [Liquorilactobacillus vini]|uniref:DNA mismatch repair protein MutL n=3 Tax=Liquorilactobacillus vini TaxID=238015 RepID=A0A0R2CAQ6_9LACO|nr:DNA mismatch repair endonuclease MutL [Liquorilactobacillus vini]KRM88877.1 DNA mismatch repair protein [Liquorilactobacillus vini DSM 20605]